MTGPYITLLAPLWLACFRSRRMQQDWREIYQQEELQRHLLDLAEQRRQDQQAQKQQTASTGTPQNASPTGTTGTLSPRPAPGVQKKRKGADAVNNARQQQPALATPKVPAPPPAPRIVPPSPAAPVLPRPPVPDPDDDEPDRL